MQRLNSAEALEWHLQSLLQLDPRLFEVCRVAGPFSLRSREPGFSGLARIVCGQVVSVASANAVWRRLSELPNGTEPEGILILGEDGLRGAGLSGGKARTLMNLARAISTGDLDLASVETLPTSAALAELTRHKGIGPWTAEIYLMFCAGDPDIFPAGDLALQKAVSDALLIEPLVDSRTLASIAADWAPHRATAALLFWRFYAATRGRQGIAT
jgi:DNA-3-methyladenine glycosylase II